MYTNILSQRRHGTTPVSTARVMRTELDQCEFGFTSEDELGRAPAKKPTSLLTNSVEVYRTMGVNCKGGHRHVQLLAGRAAAYDSKIAT